MTYKTESAVIAILENLTGARVSHHRDSQPTNTIERKVVFKAVVAAENAESIVNNVCDIGADTSLGIFYVGSESSESEQGEIRYLLFEAKINPYEE
jgi:hypothetical protein